MSNNLRKAQKHMQRASELLSFGGEQSQLEFGKNFWIYSKLNQEHRQ